MLIHNINLYSLLEFVTSLICLDVFLSKIIYFSHDLMLLVMDIFNAKSTFISKQICYVPYNVLRHFSNYKCARVFGNRLWNLSG